MSNHNKFQEFHEEYKELAQKVLDAIIECENKTDTVIGTCISFSLGLGEYVAVSYDGEKFTYTQGDNTMVFVRENSDLEKLQ